MYGLHFDHHTLSIARDGELLSYEPLAVADYVALLHPETLQPVTTLENAVTLVALAVRIGKTRLIDNTLIAPPGVSLARNRTGKS